jgi:hypothetical protein
MRIYIEPATTGDIMTSYYLLDNIQHFSLHRNGQASSVTANFPSNDSFNQVKIVENIDEKAAYCAISELLTLTGTKDEVSVAIISWDGEHFMRRFV